ncbi:MAG TPA: glycoside hydrolase family 16 protein [Niabella sp.]|nr:glycoside hydrolase family 16 protein [Niabella sp.]HOZ98495.1 glycoside hydrolase family 16 protein [Niabella sp.]HQW15994.1 glycoside hydrolase family 16 protein [Niabella sp.]HQX21254.1 glycoside hydrolase family 16 protein [Niabella sp.]HQX42064.1 glycoside hydrolase family 16 protein [Niabella sp.]
MREKLNYLFVFGVFSSAVVLFCNCKQKPTPFTSLSIDSSKVIFFDDFSGPALDTNHWNVEETGIHVNAELQAYIKSDSTIWFAKDEEAMGAKNGALILQPRFSKDFETMDGQKFDFVSGRINTKNKFDFAFGTAEARIKLTSGDGLWPAWWLLGNGNWPETGEIDIMENIGESDWANAAVHGKGYSGDAGLVNRQYFADSNDVRQWHIYAVDWSPDTLIFKYDGKPIFRVTKPMIDFFGPWAFDNPKYLILNFAVGGVYPFKINGIKQPYYGLSQTTLNLIKQGKSRMMVDWVRVKKR